jgi:hypothetical protein
MYYHTLPYKLGESNSLPRKRVVYKAYQQADISDLIMIKSVSA